MVALLLLGSAVAHCKKGASGPITTPTPPDAAVDTEAARTAGLAALRAFDDHPPPSAEAAKTLLDVYEKFKSSPEVRIEVRVHLVLLHLPEARTNVVSTVLDGLRKTASVYERQRSALCLLELEPDLSVTEREKARGALFDAVADSDPLVGRDEIVWALVVYQEPRAWEHVVPLIQNGRLLRVRDIHDQAVFSPALLARMAGSSRLAQLVNDPNVAVRRIAAAALAVSADETAYSSLVKLAGDVDPDVALSATVGVLSSGKRESVALLDALIARQPGVAPTVIQSLAFSSGAPGLSVLIHGDGKWEARALAVRTLSELGDPDGADALAFVLGNVKAGPLSPVSSEQIQNARSAAALGLATLGDPRAVDGLIEIAEGVSTANSMDAIRSGREALRRLATLAVPAGYSTRLLKLLENPALASDALVALASGHDPAVGAALMQARYLENVDLHQNLTMALCKLGYAPGVRWVAARMKRPAGHSMVEPSVADEQIFVKRRDAIRAVAWTRSVEHVPALEAVVEDREDSSDLRAEAALSLAFVADVTVLERMVQKVLDPSQNVEVRVDYAQALAVRSNPEIAVTLMRDAFKPGVDALLLRALAETVGLGGDATVAPLIKPFLGSTDSNVRLNAAIAAILSGTMELSEDLTRAVKTDSDLSGLLTAYFVPGRSTAAGDSVEPQSLEPLTGAMFDDGRLFRRGRLALQLAKTDPLTFSFAANWLRVRLQRGWATHPLGLTPFEVRAKLRDAAKGTNLEARENALLLLKLLTDRGSLLWLARQPNDAGAAAKQTLASLDAK